MLSLKVLRVLGFLMMPLRTATQKAFLLYAMQVQYYAPFVAPHKSSCSTVNRIIYSNMLAFWLLPQLFQDKSNVVVQCERVPQALVMRRGVNTCEYQVV
jgi:hypothetical protein